MSEVTFSVEQSRVSGRNAIHLYLGRDKDVRLLVGTLSDLGGLIRRLEHIEGEIQENYAHDADLED